MAEYPDALVVELEAHRAGIKRDNEASLAAHRAATMRDVFACHAMEALIRRNWFMSDERERATLAHQAYLISDAMMAERATRERGAKEAE